MTLRQLRYFVEIARSGSVTLAAQTLCVAQPALSSHIAALEKELDVRLFERHAKGVQLSEAGERLYAHALDVLARFDGIKANVSQTEALPAGKVRLCISGAIAGAVAAPLLLSVERNYPQVELTVTEGLFPQVQLQLESRIADLAMMPSAVEIPGMSQQAVVEEELMLYGSPARIEALPDELPFKAITALPLAEPDRSHDGRKMIERIAANAGLSLSVKYELNSVAMLMGVVRAGLAYTVLPTSLCADAVSSGALARRSIAPRLLRIQAIVWLNERPLTPAAAAVKEELVLAVRDLVETGALEGRLV